MEDPSLIGTMVTGPPTAPVIDAFERLARATASVPLLPATGSP